MIIRTITGISDLLWGRLKFLSFWKNIRISYWEQANILMSLETRVLPSKVFWLRTKDIWSRAKISRTLSSVSNGLIKKSSIYSSRKRTCWADSDLWKHSSSLTQAISSSTSWKLPKQSSWRRARKYPQKNWNPYLTWPSEQWLWMTHSKKIWFAI